jgi:hypothetical protein
VPAGVGQPGGQAGQTEQKGQKDKLGNSSSVAALVASSSSIPIPNPLNDSLDLAKKTRSSSQEVPRSGNRVYYCRFS